MEEESETVVVPAHHFPQSTDLYGESGKTTTGKPEKLDPCPWDSQTPGRLDRIRNCFCFRTRLRIIISVVIMAILVSLIIFFSVRVSQALQILNSTPNLKQLKIDSLCTNQFALNIQGSLLNPSSVGASVSLSEIQISTPYGVVANLQTSGIELSSGNNPFDLDMYLDICDNCVDPLRTSSQDWIDGNSMNVKVVAKVTASFAPNVFIFPIKYSTSIQFETILDSVFNQSYTEEERVKIAIERAMRNESSIDSIEILTADNTTLEALIRINLTSSDLETEENEGSPDKSSLFGDLSIFVNIPSIFFGVILEGQEAALAHSAPMIMTNSLGLVDVIGNIGWSHVDSARNAVEKFLGGENMTIGLVGKSTESLSNNNVQNECFIQTVVEGIRFNTSVDVFPSVAEYEKENNNVTSTFLDLVSLNLDSIDTTTAGALILSVIDLESLAQSFRIKGTIPPYLRVDVSSNITDVNSRNNLFTLSMADEVSISTSESTLMGVDTNLQISNATSIFQFFEQATGIAGPNFNPFVFITVLPDNNLLSSLLSAINFEFPVNGLFEEPEDVNVPESRSLNAIDAEPSKFGISAIIDDNHVRIAFKLTDITPEDAFGAEVAVRAINFSVGTKPFGNSEAETQDFSYFTLTPIDVKHGKGENINVELTIYDDLANGEMLYDIITRFTQYKKIDFELLGTYNFVAVDPIVFEIASTEWEKQREDIEPGPTEVDGSFFSTEINHVEFLGINGSKIALTANYAIQIENVEADISISELLLRINDCTDMKNVKALASIDLGGTLNTVEANNLDMSIGMDQTNEMDFVNFVARVISGNSSRICLGNDPISGNFLSNFFSLFKISFELGGLTLDQTENAISVVNKSLFKLDGTSDNSSFCMKISVDLTDANRDWGTSVGWGALNLSLSYTDIEAVGVSTQSAFLGAPCDSAFASDACTSNVLTAKLCIVGDSSNEVDIAHVARTFFKQVFLDGESTDVVLSGICTNRKGSDLENLITNAAFSIPKDTLSIILDSGSSLNNSTGLSIEDIVEYVELNNVSGVSFFLAAPGADSLNDMLENFDISIPTFQIQIFTKSSTGVEAPLLAATFDIHQILGEFSADIILFLSAWQAVFDALLLLNNDDAASFWLKGDSINFMSLLIPNIELFSPNSSSSSSVEISIDASLKSTSTVVGMLIGANASTVDGTPLIPIDFKWTGDKIDVADGESNVFAFLTIPNGIIGGAFSHLGPITLDLMGEGATKTAGLIFQGHGVPLLATSDTGRYTTSFELSKDILNDLAIGTDNSSSYLSDTFALNEFAVVGGDEMGSDIVLPCPLTEYCQNLGVDESSIDFTGITFGVDFSLPGLSPGGAFSYSVKIESNIDLNISANGLSIAEFTLKAPFELNSANNGPDGSNVVIMRLSNWTPDILRFTADRIFSTESFVLNLAGSLNGSSDTFLSETFSTISQDLYFPGGGTDDSESSMLGELDIRVMTARKTELTVSLETEISYLDGEDSFNIEVPLGSAVVKVLNQGLEVMSASLVGNEEDGTFTLKPQPQSSPIKLVAKLYRDTVGGPLSTAMNDLLTKFIFPQTLPLEIIAEFTPSVRATKYNSFCTSRTSENCAFSFQTWITIPKTDAPTEFIESFEVSIGLSIVQTITSADAQITAVKNIKNTMPFPILVSYFEYRIVLYDTDGTKVYGYDSYFTSTCREPLQPCINLVPFVDFCYEPYTEPGRKKNIIENNGGFVRVGDPDRPATSVTSNGQPIAGGSVGQIDFVLNAAVEDLARMYEDYYYRFALCVDVTGGRIVIGLKGEETCSDNPNTKTDDLLCTFVVDLNFDLYEYPLISGDSCRGPYGAQEDLDNPINLSTGYDWKPPTMNFTTNGNFIWANEKISYLDSFQAKVSVELNGDGDDIRVWFSPDKSKTVVSLEMFTVDCNKVKTYASQANSRPTLSRVGKDGSFSIIITFDAYTQRARFRMEGGTEEYSDFDFTPRQYVLSDAKTGYIGIEHNKRGGSSITNFKLYFSKADSSKTTPVSNKPSDNEISPKLNEIGHLAFQLRDSYGRRKGTGGHSWLSRIEKGDGSVATLIPLGDENMTEIRSICSGSERIVCENAVCFCDFDDGIYYVLFSTRSLGRYRVEVASTSAENNPNVFVMLSDRVYVRA